MIALIIILTMLYFPIIPTISLGPFKASPTAFPILFLAGMALLKLRQKKSVPQIASWQKILLFFLALSFALSSIFTSSMRITLSLLPNMGLYLLELFAIPILVDSNRKLVTIAKTSMVLAFILSIWRIELGPLRDLLGLSNLGGINGIVFNFHPTVAIGLVVYLAQPEWFSRRWQWFSILTLLSLILHGVEAQTRAAWIAWVIILVILLSRIPTRSIAKLIFLGVPVIILLLMPYASVLITNLEQTQLTAKAMSSDRLTSMSTDDLIREVGLRAGLAMFRERPFLGWGPGLYPALLGKYNPLSNLHELELGAFNAWLLALAETGLLGVTSVLALVFVPLWITWRQLGKRQTEYNWLAFAFALGELGMAVHLLFISNMYSFFWIHVGLALAGVRLANVETDTNVPLSPTSNMPRYYRARSKTTSRF